MIKRQFTFAVIAALLKLGLLCVPVSAGMSVYGGMERFNWREFDASGAQLLEESGYRPFAGMKRVAEGDAGLLLDYEGRIYGNDVGYDGQTQSGVPLNSKTGYFGMLAEIKPHIRTRPARLKGNYLDITSALGVDYWIRVLRDGTDQSGSPVSGYREEYLIMYVRLGLERRPSAPVRNWHAGAGIKYPVYTFEKAYISRAGYDRDTVLRPDPDFSLYANAGYRFSEKWSFTFYYDSYIFRKSPAVPAQNGGVQYMVRQPESLQYTLGLMLNYHFQSNKPPISGMR